MAKLTSIEYYLPEGKITNEDISLRFPTWSVDKIAQKTGISERRIAAEDEFASDLAINAAEKLFKNSGITKDDIGFLLYCTQSPDYFLPTTACILQQKLGLPKNIGALDYNLGCSGYVYGLALAKGLVDGNMAKNVLLLTAETYSKFINALDKGNLTLFGDAGSASIISNTEHTGGAKISDFVFGTDGSGAENLIVKNGGMVNLKGKGQDIFNEDGFVRNDDNLFMNGMAVFNFTVKVVPEMINELLEKHQLHLNDIDYFVFHQANRYMLNVIRKKLLIPEDKFLLSMSHCGNTVSSTIPIVLNEFIKENKFKAGEKVLLAGFGVGLSWAATIIGF